MGTVTSMFDRAHDDKRKKPDEVESQFEDQAKKNATAKAKVDEQRKADNLQVLRKYRIKGPK